MIKAYVFFYCDHKVQLSRHAFPVVALRRPTANGTEPKFESRTRGSPRPCLPSPPPSLRQGRVKSGAFCLRGRTHTAGEARRELCCCSVSLAPADGNRGARETTATRNPGKRWGDSSRSSRSFASVPSPRAVEFYQHFVVSGKDGRPNFSNLG